jgi:uncharacterized protein
MTPQERDVISGIFDRLRNAAQQPRDPEVERFIAERMREQPYAPYAMAQSIYVQETALANLQAQVEQLQQQMAQMQRQPQEQPKSGGFFGKLFDNGAAQPPVGAPGFAQAPQQAQASGPWGQRPVQPQQPAMGQPASPWAQQPPQRQGGGFLASAMTTAAGVAGGMVLGNVLMNAFKGDPASAANPASASQASATQASDAGGSAEPQGPTMQEASYEEPGMDDGFDGGGDWA